MLRKDKVIHISNLPSTFKGNITRNGRFIQNGIPPLGGAYDKVAKSTDLIRLGNEFLYNDVNNLVSKDNREKLMNNTAGRLINYVKDFNKESFPSDDELGPTFPFNIIQTPRSNGKNLPQKQYAVGGKIPNVVAGGIAQPIGNNFFYMNGRKHSQGGIDIGPSDKTGIEVEDGEVVETNGNELKVYSAQPIINGVSPAKLVMGGANPNKVFKAQEDFKDRNGINDDGTKAKYGKEKYVAKSDNTRVTPIMESPRNSGIKQKVIDIPDVLQTNIDDTRAFLKTFNKWNARYGYDPIPLSAAKNPKQADNVKNGLIHSPSSTGGLRDKFAVGGTRINRHGRTWEYDEQIGAYVPITNRTINRTSTYPINKSARGETIIGSDYTFRNGRWSKNNNVNTNANKPNVDNGNRRPQYYAERRLPLFEDGAGITSGLVRAGWSHGNNKGVSINNTNIPSLSATKSSGKTPRGGRSKSSQSTQSISTKTPPTAVYNRNLPKVEASIPTTLPVSTNTPAQEITSSDGKGQGRFKNLTTADWIGLGSNVAGSLASYFASKRAINKMRGPGQPTLISANKLKTKYNINPQLDRIREDKFEAYRDIDSNTASSRVSLARKQRVRNAAGQAVNELYGNRENIETNLINQDRRNQQSVRQFNAQQYNQYIDRKTAFDNGIREAKVTNINNLFSGINAGIQDMISRYENRKALNNTIGAMRASAPNVDDRIMKDAGVDYDEFIIRKRRKLGGKQSCR
nr:MAG: hypothetical protein [Bacteriophage sp.]